MSERSHLPHHRNLVPSVPSQQCGRRTHLTALSPGRRVGGSPSWGRQRRGRASWRNKATGAVGTAVWRNGGTKPILLDPRSRHVSVFTATPARPRDFAKFQNELIWSFSMKSANTARRRARGCGRTKPPTPPKATAGLRFATPPRRSALRLPRPTGFVSTRRVTLSKPVDFRSCRAIQSGADFR